MVYFWIPVGSNAKVPLPFDWFGLLARIQLWKQSLEVFLQFSMVSITFLMSSLVQKGSLGRFTASPVKDN